MIKTRVKELQQKKGISSYQMSRDLGIHRNTVTAWKNNKLAGVKFENVQAIMLYFGLDSFDQLFELIIDEEK